MISTYFNGKFPLEYIPTVHEQHEIEFLVVDKKVVGLNIFDTAGQEEYDRLRSLLYPDMDIAIVVFSLAEKDSELKSSLENVKTKWVPEIKHFRSDVPFVLVGTKKDLRDQFILNPSKVPEIKSITRKEKGEELKKSSQKSKSHLNDFAVGQRFADSVGASKYMECSALTLSGLKDVFDEVCRIAISQKKAKKPWFRKCTIL